MARLGDLDLPERLFVRGHPFKRYAPRPDDPVTTAITSLRKLLAEGTSFSDVSAVTASFRDAELAVAHTTGIGSAACTSCALRSLSIRFRRTSLLRDDAPSRCCCCPAVYFLGKKPSCKRH